MIEVDYRVGSEHLVPLLDQMLLPTSIVELTFGDVAFFGNGPEGRVSIGIEVKRIRDLVNSIRDGRLSGYQLPGMTNHYYACLLIVEGMWQPGDDGRLQIWRSGQWETLTEPSIMYAEVDNHLSTLQWEINLRYKRTGSTRETAHVIANQYRRWQKAHGDPTAHTQFYDSGFEGTFPLKPLGVVERFSHAILPGMGLKKCQNAAQAFGSVVDMALSDESDWRKIDGIGSKMAKDMVASIRGQYDARQPKHKK